MLSRVLTTTVLVAVLSACQQDHRTVEEKTEALLAQMTLDEKVGQMTQVDSAALKGREQDVATYFLGAALSGGNSNPPTGNSAEAWKEMVAALDAPARRTRLRIPLIFGIDAVHGNNNIDSATIFPHNIGLGATRDPASVERAAHVTADEVAAVGIDWTFAPCVAVAQDERWGRTYESFGENPDLVAAMGAAMVRGLQGPSLASSSRILSCTKHFIGDGGTAGGRDEGDTHADPVALRSLYLPPYAAAIDAGTKSIMVSYSSWNGVKMHEQRELITGVLKGELKFQGFVVSDWAAIDQISTDYKACVERSINAGIDMVMIPYAPGSTAKKLNTYCDFITDLKQLVAEGKVPMSRIDDAVRRILRVKFQLGLFDARKGSSGLFAAIGSPAHREIARDCVRKSLVLLQNRGNVLPLSKHAKRIGLTGKGANALNVQCGGWTIDWQGFSEGTLKGGTTILAAVKASVSPGTQVVYSPDGNGLEGCDVVLAVIGEGPYAEFKGDRRNLSLDDADLKAIALAHSSPGSRVVAVILSGRPLIIDPILASCDGIIAAWLPGSEGLGVADVLFGDYKPTGKLPCSWPRSMEGVAVHVGDPNYAPLFSYGFGRTYQ